MLDLTKRITILARAAKVFRIDWCGQIYLPEVGSRGEKEELCRPRESRKGLWVLEGVLPQ